MCWLEKNFKDTFPKPPMTAFTNHKNIKSLIIKAKVYPENPQRKQRLISGMFPCKMPCLICPFVKKLRKISGDQFTWQLESECHVTHLMWSTLVSATRIHINKGT